MDAGEGPGSDEPGPSARADRLETLRRRLYGPDGSAEVLQEYLGVEAALSGHRPAAVPDPTDEGVLEAPAPPARRTARPRVTAALIGLLVLIVPAAAVWGWTTSVAALPDRIDPPAAPGRTLLFHSREANPLSAPDKVTFEPADERMLFRADGRRLVVALDCVGRGSVRITAAEQHFDFTCGDRRLTRTRRSDGPVHGAFLILGRTIGDVVWGLRLTSVPVAPGGG